MTDEERAYNYASKQKASKFQIGEIAKFYNDGYHQAEKDLELTWGNMFDIFHLVNEVLDDYADGKTKKEVGEEVLKRFKDLKK